jgi:hypothetical protein
MMFFTGHASETTAPAIGLDPQIAKSDKADLSPQEKPQTIISIKHVRKFHAALMRQVPH